MGLKGILFDLDGTLWDSSESVARSWVKSLQDLDYPGQMNEDIMKGYMGMPMDQIADGIFSMYPKEERQKLSSVCEAKENDYVAIHGGKLFEGIEPVLRDLKNQGYFIALVSNCQSGYIEAFLKYTGYGDLFDDYECFGGTGKYKDENIRIVMERNHLDQAVYVGDIDLDYQACVKTDIPFIHARYGFGDVDAWYGIDSLYELPEAAKEAFKTWQTGKKAS